MNLENGKVVLELPPTEGNPRNSEGAFLKLQDGRLMFAYSRFVGGSWDDDASAAIAARFSADEGDTWSEDEILIRPEHFGAKNLMSVSLLRLGNGDIGLFFIIRHGWHDTRLNLMRSSDEGRTWSEPVCCIPALGYFVTNNDRVVRLSNGRLIVPAAYHRMRGESITDWKSFDGRGILVPFLSDDDGRTWREARNMVSLNVPHSRSGLQEPGLVELENGTLWMHARTDMGRHYECFSFDSGETWTDAVPSMFTGPCSPLSIRRDGQRSGPLLAVWNPIPNYQTRVVEKHFAGRAPLVAAVSGDDGRTWSEPAVIETEEERGGYCYTAIHFTADAVLLAYCAGLPEDGVCLARLRMRKIARNSIGC